MADGWQDYQRMGLREPSAVRAATKSYREESDLVGQFLGERCHVATTAHGLGQPGTKSSILYQAWAAWCKHDGEEPGANKEFTAALAERGFSSRRESGGVWWLGITLMTGDSPDGET